jgi:hypothetical protein
MTDPRNTNMTLHSEPAPIISGLPMVADKAAMRRFIAALRDPENLELQKMLAAAYDEAVAALIGANDEQVEGRGEKARKFKKKSAWRKLARHFGISTSIVTQAERWIGEGRDAEFLASCTVRALAPWGQSAEATGACATDEEEGFRKITIADAIATAETRATNRAVSSLIAMGEVSAEEINRRERDAVAEKSLDEMTLAEAEAIPFPWRNPEKYRGKTLAALSLKFLRTVLGQTAKEIDEGDQSVKRAQLKRACEVILAARGQPASAEQRAEIERLLGVADLADDAAAKVRAELADEENPLASERAAALIVRLSTLADESGVDEEPAPPAEAPNAPAEAPNVPAVVVTPNGVRAPTDEEQRAVNAAAANEDKIEAAAMADPLGPPRRKFGVVSEPFGDEHFIIGNARLTLCERVVTQTWPIARGLFTADTSFAPICEKCRANALQLEASPAP